MEREIQKMSTWIKLSARFKTFLKTMSDGVCGQSGN
jgi:hypothetical protein